MLDNKEINEQLEKLMLALEANSELEPAEQGYNLEVLPDGQFIAYERVTIAYTMIYGNNTEQRIKELTDQYLAILPPGTFVLSVEQLPVRDICIPYVIKFSNPHLAHIKRVELQYVRNVAVVCGIAQNFNLITGMSYFDVDDKELYKKE